MKVLILGNGESIHIQKWVNGLLTQGVDIFLFSLNDFSLDKYNKSSRLKTYSCGINGEQYTLKDGSLNKLKYIKVLPALKRIIKNYKPNLLHAHYCSSYGTLGALSGFHPYIISVWGSDVYDFPKKNTIFKKVIERNFKKADMLLSTSHVMAKETQKYTNKEVFVTPFGVDTKFFSKQETKETDEIIVGTIKTLDYKYGIDTLIDAFHILFNRNANLNLKLKIVGKGPDEAKLKKLVEQKGLENQVDFVGQIPNDKVPEFLSNFNVYVALSRLDSESFGVAIVEALSCETPVVVSNVDGFSEVVVDNHCGFIVAKDNPQAATQKIEQLLFDEALQKKFSVNGRKRVLDNYNWDDNLNLMIHYYQTLLEKKHTK